MGTKVIDEMGEYLKDVILAIIYDDIDSALVVAKKAYDLHTGRSDSWKEFAELYDGIYSD